MIQETIICQMHSLYKIWVSYSSVFLLLPVHTRFYQFVHPNLCPLSGRDRAVSWQHRRFVLAQGVHRDIVSMCIKSIILRMCNYYPAFWFPALHHYSIRHRSHEKMPRAADDQPPRAASTESKFIVNMSKCARNRHTQARV